MGKRIALITLALLCLLVFTGCRSAEEIQQAAQPETTQTIVLQQQQERPLITVQGKGEVVMLPDMAQISIYVDVRENTTEEAAARSQEILAAVEQVLDGFSVPKEKRSTDDVYSSPEYDYPNGKETLIGYRMRTSMTIEYDNAEKTGELVSRLLETGAQIGNVSFRLSDDSEQYQQALTLAMENARAKAETLAKAEQQTIESVWQVEETSRSDGNVMFLAKNAAVAEDSSADLQMEPGEVTVTATVTVSYALHTEEP